MALTHADEGQSESLTSPACPVELIATPGGEGRRDVLLAAHGDLDLQAAPALREQLVRALADEPRRIVVDLSDVEFMDSSGVSVLAHTYKRGQAQGCGIVLRAPQPAVRRVLELTRLSEYLRIE